jgi:hypothetical protein
MQLNRLFDPLRVKDDVRRIQAATRQQLIEITRLEVERNQEAIKANFGLEALQYQYVDGVLGKPLDQAQQFTLTRFDLRTNVVDAAIRLLMARSPIGPEEGGHYQDDHWLFINNARRDFSLEGHLIDIEPGEEVVIINMRPYARKIEGGARYRYRNRTTDRRPGLSAQAPDGVYEITARDLQLKFGKLATIRFAYRAMMGTDLVEREEPKEKPEDVDRPRNKAGRFIPTGGKPHNLSKNRFPALEIDAKLFI